MSCHGQRPHSMPVGSLPSSTMTGAASAYCVLLQRPADALQVAANVHGGLLVFLIVDLPPPDKGTVSEKTRRSAERAYEKGQHGETGVSSTRSRAIVGALKREGTAAASKPALAAQARSAARRRGAADRSAAAQKAVRTKGPAERSAAALKAARTRARKRTGH